MAFSPDGTTLATASYDNTVRLWDAPTGGFWHAISLCRFEPGELDEWIPGLRLADDASFFDLPEWKPEVRSPQGRHEG